MQTPQIRLSSLTFLLALPLLGVACHDLDEIKVPDPLPDSLCAASQIRVGDACVDEPPTCMGAPRTCGPNGNESCCVYDLIPTNLDANQGTFDRGFDKSRAPTQENDKVIGFQPEGKATAIVSPFFLDRYEVTKGRFRKFYLGYDEWLRNNPLPGIGGHSKSAKAGWKNEWRSQTLFATSKDLLQEKVTACQEKVQFDISSGDINQHQPMTCINWYEAYLFCIYDGGRLPTEAEWNFAAAGGSQQRPYPWSKDESLTTIGDDYANVGAPAGAYRVYDVGHFPKGVGRYGQYDLAGNALEWVFDRCDNECETYKLDKPTDPIEVELGDGNVIGRGGSFRWTWRNARTAYRQTVENSVSGRYMDTGVRCARNGP
jgi:formylglycine-generating enzyme